MDVAADETNTKADAVHGISFAAAFRAWRCGWRD
jgi:hypothetical protein